MEHVLYTHIISNMDHGDIFFFSNQHGFRKHHSCISQLFEFTTNLHFNNHSSAGTDVIFIDFAKAFDTVPDQQLLLKLSLLHIHPSVIRWIDSFLIGREQSVSVDSSSSTPVPVTSGVPQGSVLGPLLFLIYINDLPSSINSTIRLFADDCVVYRKITDPTDHYILQNDLDTISSWCTHWQMNINPGKCKQMTVATNSIKSSREYSLLSQQLESVSLYKYLARVPIFLKHYRGMNTSTT